MAPDLPEDAGARAKAPEEETWPAAQKNISLSQAILAPLDAVFKAQTHAARSFLSFLLQLGYPHQPLGPAQEPTRPGQPPSGAPPAPGTLPAAPSPEPPPKDTPYYLEFAHEIEVDGVMRRQRIRVPTLALVPVAPLAVQSAEFRFSLAVRELGRHRQVQKSEEAALSEEDKAKTSAYSRPWFLVSEPMSVRGVLASPGPKDAAAEQTSESRIEIEIKVGSVPIPAGLDKLLTALTQVGQLTDLGPSS
jgi:hypothetical protein